MNTTMEGSMNYYQERIETDSVIPARIYLGSANYGNNHYPLHWHEHLEFDLVLSGSIRGYVKQKQVEVGIDDFFFANSGELHETKAEDRAPFHTITLLLSFQLLKEYCPELENYEFDFTGQDMAKKEVVELIKECAKIFEKKEEYYELELSIVLRKICYVLLKDCKKKKEVNYTKGELKDMHQIKKILAYMEENYDNIFSLNTIADDIGMSPTYFSRFFKKCTGESYYNYLNKIRLAHAQLELMNSDSTITTIAFNNGFSNVKSFIEIFKSVYKNTPAKYRSLHKGIKFSPSSIVKDKNQQNKD